MLIPAGCLAALFPVLRLLSCVRQVLQFGF
jgi:hypothetical protein